MARRLRFAFTRWLFNHPTVLTERAEIIECKEAILLEREGAVRKKFFGRELLLIDSIDDVLSQSLQNALTGVDKPCGLGCTF